MGIKVNLKLLILLFLITAKAHAVPYRGFSSYAAMGDNYQPLVCDDFLAISAGAKKPAMAVLYGSFGYNWGCVDRFLAKFADRPHVIEVILKNHTCTRPPRKCYAGDTKGTIRDRALVVKKHLDPLVNKNTTVIVVPELEYDNGGKEEVAEACMLKSLTGYKVARSSTRRIKRDSCTDFIELHAKGYSSPAKPCIWNGDGLVNRTAMLKQYDYWNKRCSVVFVWTGEGQGLYESDRGFVKPTLRYPYIYLDEVSAYRKLLAK